MQDDPAQELIGSQRISQRRSSHTLLVEAHLLHPGINKHVFHDDWWRNTRPSKYAGHVGSHGAFAVVSGLGARFLQAYAAVHEVKASKVVVCPTQNLRSA